MADFVVIELGLDTGWRWQIRERAEGGGIEVIAESDKTFNTQAECETALSRLIDACHSGERPKPYLESFQA